MLLRMFVHLWIFSFLLKLCGATDIPCAVTQDGELTRYSVAEFNETDCECQWLNMTNHVLANWMEQTVGPMVVSSTNRTLVTNECLKQINYSCTCFPGWVKYMAACTSNCSGNSAVLIGGEFPRWTIPTAVVVSVALLLLLLLCCRFKDRISRCRYFPVNKQDPSNPA